MRFQIARAHSFYERAYPLMDLVEPESRPALWTLLSVYHGILRTIERNQGNVFSRPARLTDMEKIGVLLQAAGMRLRHKAGLKPEWQRLRG
jgi:phytoene synthase